jgi:hypothetical protein
MNYRRKKNIQLKKKKKKKTILYLAVIILILLVFLLKPYQNLFLDIIKENTEANLSNNIIIEDLFLDLNNTENILNIEDDPCAQYRKIPKRQVCYLDFFSEINDSSYCFSLDERTRETCIGHYLSTRKGDIMQCRVNNHEGCFFGFGYGANDPQECYIINDTFLRDTCLYGYAIKMRNTTLCKGLDMQDYCIWFIAQEAKDPKLCLEAGAWKEDCLFRFSRSQVGYSKFTEEICEVFPVKQKVFCYALVEKNSELCELSDVWSDECYIRFAISQESIELCNKTNKEEYCKWNVAMNTKNSSFCDTLENKKDICYSEIALKLKNETLCKKANTLEESCEFNVLLSQNIDGESCETARFKEQCYFNLALKRAEAKLCQNSGEYESYCYTLVAEKNQNPKLCEISNEYKDICFLQVAMVTQNPKLCNNTIYSEECIYKLVDYGIEMEEFDDNLCDYSGEYKDLCYYKFARKKNDLRLCEFSGQYEDICKENKPLVNEINSPLSIEYRTNQDDFLEGDI